MTTHIPGLEMGCDSNIRKLSRCNYLFEKMRNGRSNDPLCDAIIKVEDKEFPIHKLILKSNSTYFEAMFISAFNEKNAKCIDLNGVTSDLFAILLDFMYGANIQLSEKTLLEVYQAADMFCIDSLIVECKEHLKCIWRSFPKNLFTLIELMNAEEIRKEIFEESYKNMISKSDKIAIELPFSYVVKLIEKANSEKTALNLINLLIKWVASDPKERLRHMEYIVKSLRLNLLPWSTIEEFQSKMEYLFEQQNLLDEKERVKNVFKLKRDQLKSRIISLLGSNLYTVFVGKNFEVKIDCFNCEDFKWKPRHELMLPFITQCCLYKSGRIYFMGNKKSICYTLNTENVAFLDEMKFGRLGYSACFFENDIIISGGVRENSPDTDAKAFLRYNSSNDNWEPPFMNWFYPHDDNSSITQGENVIIVGARKKITGVLENYQEHISGVFKIIPSKKQFSKVCELQKTFYKPYLTIYNNELFVFSRNTENKRFFYSKIVTGSKRKLACLADNSSPYRLWEIENFGPKLVTLKGAFSVSEGTLLISSINANGVDQLYVDLLNSSGQIESVGFLPQLNAISKSQRNLMSETNYPIIQEYFFVSM